MKKILDFLKSAAISAWTDIKKRFSAISTERWLVAGIIFFLMVLAFLFGKGCGQPVTQLNPIPGDNYIAEKADLQATISRQNIIIGDLNKDLIEMNIDLHAARKAMSSALDKASSAVKMYNQAKLTTDTSAMLTFCDSVVTEHEQYVISTQQFTRASDSIINTQAQLISNQDKLINIQRDRIKLTDAQLNKTMNEFHALAYDNDRLKKKLAKKKGTFWKGFAAGAAGILGTIILVK
jgi:hypothetical protein